MPHATFLLPDPERFGVQSLGLASARALGRADRLQRRPAGRRAQLLRHFALVPERWPIAALTRQADVGDAAGACWLRADPVHVRPDINGVRLLAHGDGLALTDADSAALLPALKPLFGDAGFPIDAPSPSRWYLRLPAEARLPVFTDPAEALGSDLFEHLAEGPEGRRWRSLLSEAQVILHNHPWNERRAAQGRPAINSLWFWGGGVLPDLVRSRHAQACCEEERAEALARAAGIAGPLSAHFAVPAGDTVFDLSEARDLSGIDDHWLQPACEALRRGDLQGLDLDFEDGDAFRLVRSQRLRFWRRPRRRLQP